MLSTTCRFDGYGAKHAGTMLNPDNCEDGDRKDVKRERKTIDIRSRRKK